MECQLYILTVRLQTVAAVQYNLHFRKPSRTAMCKHFLFSLTLAIASTKVTEWISVEHNEHEFIRFIIQDYCNCGATCIHFDYLPNFSGR